MGNGASNTQIKSLGDSTAAHPVSKACTVKATDTRNEHDARKVSRADSAKSKSNTAATVKPEKSAVASIKDSSPMPSKSPPSAKSPPVSKSPTRKSPTPLSPTPSAQSESSSITKSQLYSSQSYLNIKVKELEKELWENESEKLDLLDRIQALEERLQEVTLTSAASGGNSQGGNDSGALQETLKAKDLYIQQMEKQLAAVQADSNKIRNRLKRKIKNLTAQLSEAKQESSIAQLELKECNADLRDQLRSSLGTAPKALVEEGAEGGDDMASRMTVILDLSAQVSEQADKIQRLEAQVMERDREVESLNEMVASLQNSQVNASLDSSRSGHRHLESNARSGERRDSDVNRYHDPSSQPRNRKLSNSLTRPSFTPVESTRDLNPAADGGGGVPRPSGQRGMRPVPRLDPGLAQREAEGLRLQRQSTALSDSDDDWEMDGLISKIHSAPARVRVKSAATSGEVKGRDGADLDDKWSLATDDNDLTFAAEAAKPSRVQYGRQNRKSALKTKLERQRNERSRELMGPSLAFEAKARDQLTDTSCNNTPTPRSQAKGFSFPTTNIMNNVNVQPFSL